MKNVSIEKTSSNPNVVLSPAKKTAYFEGRSISSDGFEFYAPIIEWFENYNESSIKVDLKFDHINTISNKCVLQILVTLKKKKDAGIETEVNWHYFHEDDDMLETGEELEAICKLNMKYFKFND